MLNATDNVLRQVIDESTLQALYVKKGVPNKIFLRERLFSFKMNATKSMDENLDDFTNKSNRGEIRQRK